MIRRKLGVLKRDWLSYATTFGDCLHHFNTGQMPPPYGALRPDLSWDDVRLYLDPWYHDFSALGVPTPQAGGHFRENQAAKDEILLPLIRQHAPGKVVTELFCADGFHGFAAMRAGADALYQIDHNPHHIKKAKLAKRLLNVRSHVQLGDLKKRPLSWWPDECEHLLLNIGGLYHVERPWEILKNWRADTMILQTVVWGGAGNGAGFEAPAPGWGWGCRFSSRQLVQWLESSGWQIQEWLYHKLPGNGRTEDRQSVVVVAHGH